MVARNEFLNLWRYNTSDDDLIEINQAENAIFGDWILPLFAFLTAQKLSFFVCRCCGERIHMAGLTEEQRYLFDTFGFIVLKNVVSEQQIEELKSTLRQPTEQFDPIQQEKGPLHWGPVWRALLDLPQVAAVLEDIIGNHAVRRAREKMGRPALPTFRIDHVNIHTHVKKGFKGASLHGGWKGTGGAQFSSYHDGFFYNGLVSVSFELYDTYPNNGGFGCIPGSHKSNVRLPRAWQLLENEVPDCVTRVPAIPGDAIIFTEAITHGTLPWTSDAPRSTLFYKFSPHGSTWSGDYFDPNEFRQYEDVNDRILALLEPPNARYHGRPTDPFRSAD